MKRIFVKLTEMPFDPTYEIDDTIAIGDLVRVPGSGSGQLSRTMMSRLTPAQI